MDCSLGFFDLLFRARPQHLRPCLLWLFYQLIYVVDSTLKQTIITILAVRESLNEFVDEFQFIYFRVRTRARICKDWPYNIDSQYNRLGWAENFSVNCFDSWLKATYLILGMWYRIYGVHFEVERKTLSSWYIKSSTCCEIMDTAVRPCLSHFLFQKIQSFKSHSTSRWI